METTIVLSNDAQRIAGILLVTLVAVEWGGVTVLRMVRGTTPATGFQKAFARAGHAHAGVLVTLALVGQLYIDAAGLSGLVGVFAGSGIWIAAILMPAGFFFSSMRKGATAPNRFMILVWAGAISLGTGVLSLGIGLLVS